MSKEKKSYTFKLKRGYAYINYQIGKYNSHKDFWEISISTHKKKYYFKSLDAAKLFVEINFKVVEENRK
jgi:hypothetical protein